MKKKFFLIFLIIFLGGNVFAEEVCTDSDGGEDYAIMGTVVDKNKDTQSDFCSGSTHSDGTSNWLVESYCNEGGNAESKAVKCVCKDGACIREVCTDSDGGLDYLIKGTTVGMQRKTVTDSCDGEIFPDGTFPYLKEYYCKGFGETDYELVRCICKDGACVKKEDVEGCCVISNTASFEFNVQQCYSRMVESENNNYRFFENVLEDDCEMGYCAQGNYCNYQLKSYCTREGQEWKGSPECSKDESEFDVCERAECGNFVDCLDPFGGFCSSTRAHSCRESGGIVMGYFDDECDPGCCEGFDGDEKMIHFTGRERCNVLDKTFSMKFNEEISEGRCKFLNDEGFICIRGHCQKPADFKLENIRVSPSVSPAGTMFVINTEVIEGEPYFFPLEVIISDNEIVSSSSEGIIETITLFDDGDHGDKKEGDGVFGNIFDSASQLEGDYFVGIEIGGKVENIANFSISNSECIEVIKNGDSSKKADIVFVGENYESTEEFIKVLDRIIDYEDNGFDGLFGIEPFKSNKEKFNIWAVDAGSETVYEETEFFSEEDRYIKISVNKCLIKVPFKGCVYSVTVTKYIEIKPPYITRTFNFASKCPQAEYKIFLSKEEFRSFCYSGGSCHVSDEGDLYTGKVLIHEFGHGFAKLSDEYLEPSKGNRARHLNCADSKEEAEGRWGHLVNENDDVDYFSGCAYIEENYRPTRNSIMKNSRGSYGFGTYNEEVIKKELDKYE